ncbi:MAG: ABC transporter substrate-binding protein, partial [Actinobacteria bacterium]|nr:ABC transporter substrate-binding protein [Actinomycetota bacterium]
ELERLCESLGFGSLRQLDVDSLHAAIEQLAAFELARSSERRALFDEIDALTAELVRRYKDGGANVDSLLAE